MAPPHGHTLARSLRALSLVALATGATSCTTISGSIENLDGREGQEMPPPTDPTPAPTATISLDDGADWIQLVSGEWLRGKILRIRSDSLDFDSDELDDQTFGIDDVKQIFSPHHQVVLTVDGRVFEGAVTVDGANVWIVSDTTVQLDRADVLSILALDENAGANWSGEISLGATLRSGNTDQTDYSGLMEVVRESARTRWFNRYTGAIGNVNSTETTNNHRLGSTFDVYLTKRTFLTVPGVDVYSDKFQNIAYRITPYAAMGYALVDTSAHDWSVSAGPAYQYVELDSVDAGADAGSGSAAVTFSSKYSWDITGDVEFDFDYSITAPVPDTNEYNHNFVLRLSVDLLGDIDLDVSFIWDRVNDPQVDGDGFLPEQDDYRTTIGLGWDF